LKTLELQGYAQGLRIAPQFRYLVLRGTDDTSLPPDFNDAGVIDYCAASSGVICSPLIDTCVIDVQNTDPGRSSSNGQAVGS